VLFDVAVAHFLAEVLLCYCVLSSDDVALLSVLCVGDLLLMLFFVIFVSFDAVQCACCVLCDGMILVCSC